MKQCVLVAFLIAAGCAETPVRSAPSGGQNGEPTASFDCDAAIARGIKRLTAGLRDYAPDPQTLESGVRTFERIQGALARRCIVDSWPPEVTQCFATMERRTDIQACQSRLSAEPSSKLATEIAEATRSMDDRDAESVPLARRRRPSKSREGYREALDMMKAFKVDLCNCNDHDLNCGKVATDAYQRAMMDWAATRAGTGVDISAKPDPELEKLTTEVADCARRVMTPAPGPAGSASAP